MTVLLDQTALTALTEQLAIAASRAGADAADAVAMRSMLLSVEVRDAKSSRRNLRVTIAGNLLARFGILEPAADIEFRYRTNGPTVRLEGLTIAGR
jgi:hypothetical protein